MKTKARSKGKARSKPKFPKDLWVRQCSGINYFPAFPDPFKVDFHHGEIIAIYRLQGTAKVGFTSEVLSTEPRAT